VQTACATPPSYMNGDTTHTAHEYFLPMLILGNIILSVFYIFIYIYIVKKICIYTYSGYARKNVIGSRTSLVIASVRSSTH